MKITLDFLERLFSGSLPFVLTVLLGGYFTIKTRFFQFKNLVPSFLVLKGEKGDKKASFLAMCNSLSAAIGTGNIVGVAAAVSLGGAGAIFWMWITALLGMVIKAGEIALGVYYREKNGDNFQGGPIFYIKNGLNKKWGFLGAIFAVLGLASSFFCGNITQINSAAASVSQSMWIRLIIGVIAAAVIFFVIRGGVKKIFSFLGVLLPFMSVLYILLCVGVLVLNLEEIAPAFYKIFIGAVSPKSVTGGAVGSVISVISIGASKGIFSNEAGLGTAAIAHSSVRNTTPKTQSLFGIFEVFVDTILICTLTGLTILTSGVIIDYGTVPDKILTVSAFSTVYGNFSEYLLSVMLLLFGISSVIGWASYGISFADFLFGEKAVKFFTLIYPIISVIGAVSSGVIVWRLAELFNGFMVIINLLVMSFLSKEVILMLKGNKIDKTKNKKHKGFFKK
ncbi:MAG: sodium:alanine symporter family protein [Clostridia bacterium]|nr:sodium:alanine symporter family protein [Clostridia bacterium]